MRDSAAVQVGPDVADVEVPLDEHHDERDRPESTIILRKVPEKHGSIISETLFQRSRTSA